MLEDFVRDLDGRARLTGSAFATALEEFDDDMQRRSYAARTIVMYRFAAGHFVRWLAFRGTPLARVDADVERRFLVDHLPGCRCPLPGPRVLHTVRAALNVFLAGLRSRGHVEPPSSSLPPLIAQALSDYDGFLLHTCGLSKATRHYRRRYLSEFLVARFGARQVEAEELGLRDVERFLTKRAHRWSRKSLSVVAGSLRSWLRYQQLLGNDVASLIAAVPRIPSWRLADLPGVLTDAEVGALLAGFDRQTSTGRRDYAIACCLADLGLRACDVALLRLDDVHWDRGAIRLAGGKARRADWLPIPPRMGRAISEYLRHGRPPTSSRALFVRHKVPKGAPIRASVVRQAMQRAATVTKLVHRWRGPHLLRHTAATRLLRGGASLKEVADVLRHRSLDTTAIYAKVNIDALREVAMPWPGRAR